MISDLKEYEHGWYYRQGNKLIIKFKESSDVFDTYKLPSGLEMKAGTCVYYSSSTETWEIEIQGWGSGVVDFDVNKNNAGFKVGDIVDYMGLEGKVVEIDIDNVSDYSVSVEFTSRDSNFNTTVKIVNFTKDGRYDVDHTKPSLILVKRAKKKIKMYGIYSALNNTFHYISSNKKEADYLLIGYINSDDTTQLVEFEVEIEDV